MNRGAMRTELADLLEDDAGQFSTGRLDRALQRAATFFHSRLVSSDTAIDFVRGSYDFTASDQSHDLSGDITDFDHYRYLIRKDGGGLASDLGRMVFGGSTERFAAIIPESQRGDCEYGNGYDPGGRPVAFFTPVLTLNWLAGAPGGEWTLVYARAVRQIPPNQSGPTGDDLSYDTIPEKHHLLIPYRAALNIQGQHNENADLAEQYAALLSAFEASIRLGTSGGYSQVH